MAFSGGSLSRLISFRNNRKFPMHQINQNRVLVLGDDMRIFLAVVRSLGRAGLEVHAIPFESDAPALTSKYVKVVHRLPLFATAPEAWTAGLLGLLHKGAYDMVIPCDDRAILALDLNRDCFAGHRIAIPNPKMMDLLFDKERTHALCETLGIPVVKELRLDESAASRDLAASIGLPLVVKPRRSYWPDRLETWGKVHIIEDERQLDETLAAIDDKQRYLAQSYFEGAGVGVSVLAHEGEILQVFQHRRLRERRGGVSTCRVSEPVNPELLKACEKICGHTSLSGVCMFEFRYNLESHAWVMIEVNARFWGSVPLPVSLGVDFPLFLYDLAVNGKVRARAGYSAGIRSRNLALDGLELLARLQRMRARELAGWAGDVVGFLSQPLRWLTGSERSDSFVGDDLKPAFAEIAGLLRHARRKLRANPEKGLAAAGGCAPEMTFTRDA